MFYGGTIYLNAGDSMLRGIDGGAVDMSGPNCLAEENTGDINLTFYSGGGSTIRNNIGSS